ncbi:hypothetical protein BG011_004556 [Mortierella polycephala]|uniref:Uncharacterized protein n=1 Tax=Mortierella polycephala TaxID=41804 RepID=A0A9P6QG45_9FUNG|nr:hypothetical protein BG011_004556 [Mortierella polycephala]
MNNPSAESARAMTQAVLRAHLCQRYHDLIAWASEPLKQRVQFLASNDHSNLKDLLLLWENTTGEPVPSNPTTTATIFRFLQEHWSADQNPLTPPSSSSLSSSSSSCLGASSWETTPVFRKTLYMQPVQAFVPIGQLNVSDLLCVVLLAEQEDAGVDVEATYHHGGGGEARRTVWKYHNMAMVPERDLLLLLQMDNNGEYMQSGPIVQRSSTLFAPLPLSPAHQTQTQTFIQVQAQVHYQQPIRGGVDDLDEDSDDEYWGQYGDADEPSVEDTSSQDPEFVRRDITGPRSMTLVEAEDSDDDEDEYWGKYGEQEAQDESDNGGGVDDSSLSDQVGDESTGTRRVLARLDTSEAMVAGHNMTAPISSPGQVDPTTLAMMLERLVVYENRDQSFHGAGDEAEEEEKMENFVRAEGDNVDFAVDDDDNDDDDDGDDGDDEATTAMSQSSAQDDFLDWSSTAGSRSRSQSQSTSISSITIITPTAQSEASLKHPSSPPENVAHARSDAILSLSISPASNAPCTDSVFQECNSSPMLLPIDPTMAPSNRVLQSLQSVVKEASHSGMSMNDILTMLSTVYEDQSDLQARN